MKNFNSLQIEVKFNNEIFEFKMAARIVKGPIVSHFENSPWYLHNPLCAKNTPLLLDF